MLAPSSNGYGKPCAKRSFKSVLFVSGTPHLPQVRGGVEVNTHETVLELRKRGVSAAVVSGLSPRDLFGVTRLIAKNLQGANAVVDHALGYPVYRLRAPWYSLHGIPRPDVAVIQNGNVVDIAMMFDRAGVPTVAYLHGLGFESDSSDWVRTRGKWPFKACVANSHFTAARFKAKFGVDCPILPLIFHPERYRTPSSQQFATFINPIPQKGIELALEIAAQCPDIPFLFVRGWPLSWSELSRLQTRAKKLGNVEIRDGSNDMRSIYGVTRVLLVPSQWEAETWGRVVTEAQFSGIPVLASNRGGLPESTGPGGQILPFDQSAPWSVALKRTWHDTAHYYELSQAALAHSKRFQIEIDHIADQLVAILASAAKASATGCGSKLPVGVSQR